MANKKYILTAWTWVYAENQEKAHEVAKKLMARIADKGVFHEHSFTVEEDN